MPREGRRKDAIPRLNIPGMHIGRGWNGISVHEMDCPCGKGPCGLVDADQVSDRCPQHSFTAGKTIRQMHWAEDCPNRQTWPERQMSD